VSLVIVSGAGAGGAGALTWAGASGPVWLGMRERRVSHGDQLTDRGSRAGRRLTWGGDQGPPTSRGKVMTDPPLAGRSACGPSPLSLSPEMFVLEGRDISFGWLRPNLCLPRGGNETSKVILLPAYSSCIPRGARGVWAEQELRYLPAERKHSATGTPRSIRRSQGLRWRENFYSAVRSDSGKPPGK
jgi:hypothetical protein